MTWLGTNRNRRKKDIFPVEGGTWAVGWRGKAAHELHNTAEEGWLDTLGSSLEEVPG